MKNKSAKGAKRTKMELRYRETMALATTDIQGNFSSFLSTLRHRKNELYYFNIVNGVDEAPDSQRWTVLDQLSEIISDAEIAEESLSDRQKEAALMLRNTLQVSGTVRASHTSCPYAPALIPHDGRVLTKPAAERTALHNVMLVTQAYVSGLVQHTDQLHVKLIMWSEEIARRASALTAVDPGFKLSSGTTDEISMCIGDVFIWGALLAGQLESLKTGIRHLTYPHRHQAITERKA